MNSDCPIMFLISDRYGLTMEQISKAVERYTIVCSTSTYGTPIREIKDRVTGEIVFSIRGWVLTMDSELEKKLVDLAGGL